MGSVLHLGRRRSAGRRRLGHGAAGHRPDRPGRPARQVALPAPAGGLLAAGRGRLSARRRLAAGGRDPAAAAGAAGAGRTRPGDDGAHRVAAVREPLTRRWGGAAVAQRLPAAPGVPTRLPARCRRRR